MTKTNIDTIILTMFISFSILMTFISIPFAYSQETSHLIAKVNQQVFSSGDTLIAYGKSVPNDSIFVKMSDPVGKSVRIDIIRANSNGAFASQIFQWPQPTKNFAFGVYTIEISSSAILSDKQTIKVTFGDNSLADTANALLPLQHILAVKLDSPTQVSVHKPFRIFVQVTFDGALVNSDPQDLLASSHIHFGNDTINLNDKFVKLHEGLYYADVKLDEEGSYIIHAMAFYKGFLSHDSKVISAGSSISDIQQSVNTLRHELDQTSQDLNDTRVSVTDAVANAREGIKTDINQAESTVGELRQASGQINSLILPILALISIIIALQISLFARIRASFK